eukprot:COSAG02_NODE_334_length_24367_cov_6.715634_26_plen_281_part_00
MGKKRNGVNNKLKGPAKWQKGSREARKLQQSRRDAKLAKAAKNEALLLQSIGDPVLAGLAAAGAASDQQVGLKRSRGAVPSSGQLPDGAVHEAHQPEPTATAAATPDTLSTVVPGLVSAVEQQLATDAGWSRLRNWMLPRLQRCCDVDAAVIAQYTSDLLRAKPVEQWPEALPRELTTFSRSKAAAHELATEMLSAIRDGSATASCSATIAAASTAMANRQQLKEDATGTKKEKRRRVKKRKAPKKAGWTAATDPTSGEIYYYHSITRETSWTRPQGFSP